MLKNKKILAVSLIAFILAGGGFMLNQKAEASSELFVEKTAVIESRNISSNVYASGNILITESRKLKPETKGHVTALWVSVGESVTRGQKLADVDSSELLNALKRKNISLEIEKETLSQTLLDGNSTQTTDLKKTLIEYSRAKSKFESDKVLFDSGSISEQSYNESKDAFERESLNLSVAQKNVENSTFDSRVRTQKLSINLIEMEIEELEEKIAKQSIVSPIDGIITEINYKAGEMYDEDKHLLRVQNMDSQVIKSLISEGEINKLEVGQNVKITATSIKGQFLNGTVSSISPSTVNKEGKNQAYTEVTITLNERSDALRDGFLVNLTIEAQTTIDAKAVAFEAITKDIDGNASVTKLLDDGSILVIPVKLGVEGDIYVEILSDQLQLGDSLLIENLNDSLSAAEESLF